MTDAVITISEYFGCSVERANIIMVEAAGEGLGLPIACALIDMESGGRNIFGCDHGFTGGQPPYCNDSVTRERCDTLIGGDQDFPYGMNGVGLTQLTWWTFVIDAELEGGVHRPAMQCRIGFRIMRRNLDVTGWKGHLDAFARYNGTGAAAQSYAANFEQKRLAWVERLGA